MRVHVGAVEFGRRADASALFASADLALARAEAGGGVVVDTAASAPAPGGEGAWRRQLAAALAERRGELGTFPVLDARGRLVHLESPLRLQLEPQGPYDAASRWPPLATRCRLTPQADRLALALDAIAADGQPRAVHVAPASLADSDFVAGVLQLLHERSQRAGQLWLAMPERAAVERFDAEQRFAALVRPLGVRFGLEHGGAQLHDLDRIEELGLDYLRLDASWCAGAAHSAAARDDADAAVLFDAGVDAVGGPWTAWPRR